jgi:putative ABC transport system ATP-binding protein
MELTSDNITIAIDGRSIIQHASLVCKPGAMTALTGPSGSGKTTLLHSLGLLLRPTSGRILVGGEDTTPWSARQRRRFWQEQAAFILQDYGIIEEESVAFNVTLSASLFGSRPAGDQQRLHAALSAAALSGREKEPAAHLSGGEKRRLSIARALYKDARAIFADEPTASLDDENRDNVIALLASLAQQGRVVVVATHDAEMIAACTTRYALEQAPAVHALQRTRG